MLGSTVGRLVYVYLECKCGVLVWESRSWIATVFYLLRLSCRMPVCVLDLVGQVRDTRFAHSDHTIVCRHGSRCICFHSLLVGRSAFVCIRLYLFVFGLLSFGARFSSLTVVQTQCLFWLCGGWVCACVCLCVQQSDAIVIMFVFSHMHIPPASCCSVCFRTGSVGCR